MCQEAHREGARSAPALLWFYLLSLAQRVGATINSWRHELHDTGELLTRCFHVEAHLPERTWIEEGETIELIEQHFNEPTRRLDGTRRSLLACEHPGESEMVPFQRRLYTVEELAETFESVGLGLANVFDEEGQPCAPSDEQQELFVEARA